MLIFKRDGVYVLCSMQKNVQKDLKKEYFRMKKMISDQGVNSTYHSEEEIIFSQKKFVSRMFSNICVGIVAELLNLKQ